MLLGGDGRHKRLGTAVLLAALVTIVVGAALSVRESVRAVHAQERAARETMHAYAQFASYLFATRIYLAARERTMLGAFSALAPSQPRTVATLPPPDVIPVRPDTTERCAFIRSWVAYRFRLDIPSRAVTFAGPPPSPDVTRFIRDSISVIGPSAPIRAWYYGYTFVHAPAGREAIAFAPVQDSAGKTIAVYGYRSCYGVGDAWDFSHLHAVAHVVPPFLVGEMPVDSILTLRITTADGAVLYQAPARRVSVAATGSTTMEELANVTVTVGLRPATARRLVIGGIPDSRIPQSVFLLLASVVLAIVAVAMLRHDMGLVELRERFLAHVSHELRTPLQQILLFVQHLRLGRARDDEEREQALRIIETETQRLVRLTDNVLGATARSVQPLNLGPVDIAHAVAAARETFAPLAAARDMTIRTDAEAVEAIADPAALQQVLLNLLDNAAKYGPRGQTIELGVRGERDAVHLWVDDAGPGVPADARSRVWEPFVRVTGKDDATGGAGIGLTIVRDLVQRMNGRAMIEDGARGGARVSLWLPRAHPAGDYTS